MADRNEFNSFEPEDEEQPKSPRYLIWITAILIVAFVGFAGGMAYFTLNQRVPAPTPTATLPRTPNGVIAEVIATTVDALNTSTPEGITTPLPQSQQPTFTATQLPSPTQPVATATTLPQPTPSCAPVDGPMALLADPAQVGCPQGSMAVVWSALERFERGAMFWRSDTDSAYILFGTGIEGTWQVSPQRWDGQDYPTRGAPPAGLLAPIRGFGYVWSTNEAIFNQLGWARQEELGFCALLQNFERGFIILSNNSPSCTADGLYNRANDPNWTPFALMFRNDGIWRAFDYPGPQPTPQAVQPTPTVAPPIPTATIVQSPPQSSTQRPTGQGLFAAQRTQSLSLDGNFNDWPDQWNSLSNIVYGAESFVGLNDIAAKFQTAWSADGLYLAAQVQDDLYRAGPGGTDMWKGDGFELHFDRDLAGDFADTTSNNDDFQLGISFGDALNQIRIYRWLPFNLEAEFAGQGTVVRTENGYNLEMLLPWTLFETNGATLQSGQNYGFNLSVNDNDSDAPTQETVLSASPARTTHDNPTEWGTLVLQ